MTSVRGIMGASFSACEHSYVLSNILVCTLELGYCVGFRQVYLRTYVIRSDHYFVKSVCLNDIACVRTLEVYV
jgi:hypothetical protein